MTSSYTEKEISEWNSTDLYNWLLDNKYRGISELCQKYSLSGYDLFFITDDILKNELAINSFHERIVILKLINKLTSEHLKLNIINSNGDNVILTLDNNHNTSLGELSKYIGNMFDINPNFILYKDNSKQEVLSPTLKIVKLMILYPKIYKTLNISNMKDYHQDEEKMINNKNNEEVNSMSKTGDTFSHTLDNYRNNENEKEKDKKINTMYSFADNSGDLNSNSISNNFNSNNNNNINNNRNNYYNELHPVNYKIPHELSNTNQKSNIILKNNNSFNINKNKEQNNMFNNISPSNNANRKYKNERRIYKERDELYYNNNQIQNNDSDYIQNNEVLESSSSNEDNEPIQYNNRDYQNNNEDINNDNYEMRKIDIQNNEYRKYQRGVDSNNNYFNKDDYNNENDNRRIKKKGGYDDEIYKRKMYNENFNDSNQI